MIKMLIMIPNGHCIGFAILLNPTFKQNWKSLP